MRQYAMMGLARRALDDPEAFERVAERARVDALDALRRLHAQSLDPEADDFVGWATIATEGEILAETAGIVAHRGPDAPVHAFEAEHLHEAAEA